MDMRSVGERVRRLAMLDTSVFGEVRTDTTATVGALIVASGAILCSGLGGWLWYIFQSYHPGTGSFFIKSAIIGSILGVILWGVWVAITYVIITQMFRGRADINELVRVMGFAMAPLSITLVMFIPQLDYAIALTAMVLMFGAQVIAVQSASDVDAGRALISAAAGFAVWALVLELLVTTNNTYAPGIFIFAPR
jgi:hypothetical protein